MHLELIGNAEPSLSDVAKFAEGDEEESDEEPPWAHDTDEIIAAKKERSRNGNGSNYVTLDKLKEEGDKAGYGKLYAACDGGVSGLQACAAGTRSEEKNLQNQPSLIFKIS